MTLWQSFWDFVWIFIWSFAFIAYLFVLFAVIRDLFRDHKLNGWFKALWIIFLIFVPFLTALVYLIARGTSMAERSQKEYQQAQESAESYIRTVAQTSPTEEIARASELLERGVISPDEFAHIKARALGTSPQIPGAHASSPTPGASVS